MLDARAARADHLERSCRRRKPAPSAYVQVTEEDESTRNRRKDLLQRPGVDQPVVQPPEARGRVERIVVDKDHRSAACNRRVREDRAQRLELRPGPASRKTRRAVAERRLRAR